MSFSTLSRLIVYAQNFRTRIYRASFYSVTNKIFDIAPEILIGASIDVVVNKETSFLAGFGVVDLTQQLIVLGTLTFFVWAFESLFEYLSKLDWRFIAQGIQHQLRCSTYGHVQNLDVSKFEEVSVGHWVSIINDDINQLERFLDTGANSIIQVITTVIAVGAIFFYLSPTIAVLAFMPIPFIIFGAFWFQKRAQTLYSSVRGAAGKLAGRLTGNLSGVATIKSFVAEKRELELLTQSSLEYMNANEKAIKVSSAFIPIIRMAILSGFLSTLVIGGWMSLNGQLNVGSYGVLVFLTQRLLWPLTGLAETVDLFERAMASTRRVFSLLDLPVEIQNSKEPLDLGRSDGRVQFESVSFSYSSRPSVLNDISFQLSSGQTLAFVGQTGSGKSTIVKLLVRFYDPSEGQILIDGHPLKSISLESLRGNIGLVSQDIFLFQGTVADNIRYGRPSASLQEVKQAAQKAEADTFIEELPDGYETMIGERGQKLSGGQRQRISLARAVIKDPPILILDEATSAVDNETEAAIQRSLKSLSVNRTIIIVAHRLSTIVNSDNILVVERGRISASGTHDELLKNSQTYKNLWSVQTGISHP